MPTKTHCINGHEYTEENTYRRVDGSRRCRTCILKRKRDRYLPHPREKRSHCSKGHPYDEVNTYTAPGGTRRRCKTCKSTWEHEYLNSPSVREKRDNYVRNWSLKRSYGISLSDYEYMLQFQEGECAICKNKPGKIRLHVDHDHETGEIRGLLCSRCNQGLGLFRDSGELLKAAGNYLSIEMKEGVA